MQDPEVFQSPHIQYVGRLILDYYVTDLLVRNRSYIIGKG